MWGRDSPIAWFLAGVFCTGMVVYALANGEIPATWKAQGIVRADAPRAFWGGVALFVVFGIGAFAWARHLWRRSP